jgi:hypothetical protein
MRVAGARVGAPSERGYGDRQHTERCPAGVAPFAHGGRAAERRRKVHTARVRIEQDLGRIEPVSGPPIARAIHPIRVVGRAGHFMAPHPAVPHPARAIVQRIETTLGSRRDEVIAGVQEQRDRCGVTCMEREVPRLLLGDPCRAQRNRRTLDR